MKKILCAVLSMLMLALPFSGMAASVDALCLDAIVNGKSVTVTSTINMNPDLAGTDEQVAAVVDLYNALTTIVTVQSNLASCSYQLNGQEAFSGTLNLENSGLYVGSNFLEKPIVIDGTELIALVKNVLLPTMVSGGVLTQEQADTCNGWIDQLMAGEVPEELQEIISAVASSFVQDLDEAANEDNAEALQLSFSNTMMWGLGVMLSGTEMENPADYFGDNLLAGTGSVITVTAEDISALIYAVAADVTESNIPALDAYAAENGTDKASLVSAAVTEMQDAVSNGGFVSAAVAYYLTEDGSLNDWNVRISTTGENSYVSLTGMYNEAGSYSTHYNFTIMAGADDGVSIDVDCEKATAEDGSKTVDAACTVASASMDDTIFFTLNSISNETALPYGTVVMKVFDVAGDGTSTQVCELDMELMSATYDDLGTYEFSETVVMSIADINVLQADVTIATGDPVASIACDDAVRLFSADADTLNTWLTGASEYAQNKLIDALNLLPESVLNLMMNSTTEEPVETDSTAAAADSNV